MAKAQIIAEWHEMAATGLGGDKERDGRFHFHLFVNHVEVRRTGKGDVLTRSLGVEDVHGLTRDAMDQNVKDFAMRPDVRWLRDGLESNDFDELPHQEKATPELMDGTADIYKAKDAAPEPAQST